MRRFWDRLAMALERLDEATGHWAGCGLLNRHIYLLFDEETYDFRVVLPSPTGYLYFWLLRRIGDLP